MLFTQDPKIQERLQKAFTTRFKNRIINGDFRVSQRPNTVNNYTIDRWISNPGTGGTPARTVTRETFAPADATVMGNPRFFYRHNQTASATVAGPLITQLIPDARTLAPASSTATSFCVLSFWMKSSVNNLQVNVFLRRNFGSTTNTDFVPYAFITPSSIITLSTVWQRFEMVFELTSLVGASFNSSGTDHLAVRFRLPTNTTFTVDLANVQLEEGQVASAFEVRDTAIETLLCQQFYQIVRTDFLGWTSSGSQYRASVHYPTAMRAQPTATVINLANSNFPATPLGSYPGTSLIIEDRQANATGNNGAYATEYRLDAELLEV